MVRHLARFLGAAGDRYAAEMRPPDEEFPGWLYRAAHLNSSALDVVASQDELDEENAAVRYVNVVFQIGEEAGEALKILDEHGEEAAVEYLARWDRGSKTDAAAEANEQIYEELPAGKVDLVYSTDAYVLNYNLAAGYVGLVRKAYQAPQAELSDQPPGSTVAASRQPRLHDFSPEPGPLLGQGGDGRPLEPPSL